MNRKFVRAKFPTPIFNSSNLMDFFSPQGIPLDKSGLFRGLEMIAFPGTLFQIIEELVVRDLLVFRVQTNEYTSECSQFFIDSRFVIDTLERTERIKELPSLSDMITFLRQQEGVSYLWGGNYVSGIPEMISFYPGSEWLNSRQKSIWKLEGLDCSGLLYQATNGSTLRNTKDMMVSYDTVAIQNHSMNDLLLMMRPLDLLIWKGHVVIVLDQYQTIEAHGSLGRIVITSLEKKLDQIFNQQKKTPVDNFDSEMSLEQGCALLRWYFNR